MILFIYMCMHTNINNHINSSRDNTFNGIVSHISPCIGVNYNEYMSYENDRMKIVKSIIGLSLWHDVQMKNRKVFTS